MNREGVVTFLSEDGKELIVTGDYGDIATVKLPNLISTDLKKRVYEVCFLIPHGHQYPFFTTMEDVVQNILETLDFYLKREESRKKLEKIAKMYDLPWEDIKHGLGSRRELEYIFSYTENRDNVFIGPWKYDVGSKEDVDSYASRGYGIYLVYAKDGNVYEHQATSYYLSHKWKREVE